MTDNTINLIESGVGSDSVSVNNSFNISDVKSNRYSLAVQNMDNISEYGASGTTPPTKTQSTDYVLSGTYSLKLQWNHSGGNYNTGRLTVPTLTWNLGQGGETSIWVRAPTPFNVVMYVTGANAAISTSQIVSVTDSWQKVTFKLNQWWSAGGEYITLYQPSAPNVMYLDVLEAYYGDGVLKKNKINHYDRPGNMLHPNPATGGQLNQSTSNYAVSGGTYTTLEYQTLEKDEGDEGCVKRTCIVDGMGGRNTYIMNDSALGRIRGITPGKSYYQKIRVKSNTIYPPRLIFAFYDYYGVQLGGFKYLYPVTQTDEWLTLEGSYTAPAGAYSCYAGLQHSLLLGEYIYLGKAIFKEDDGNYDWVYPGFFETPNIMVKPTINDLNTFISENISRNKIFGIDDAGIDSEIIYQCNNFTTTDFSVGIAQLGINALVPLLETSEAQEALHIINTMGIFDSSEAVDDVDITIQIILVYQLMLDIFKEFNLEINPGIVHMNSFKDSNVYDVEIADKKVYYIEGDVEDD